MKSNTPFFCVGEAMNIVNKNCHHLSDEMLEKIQKRTFTVKDTGLTHRQINYLTSNGIMGDAREDELSWRRFNLKELVFLNIVAELRQYGTKDTILKSLHDAFFKDMCDRATDVMMFVALAGEKVYLTIEGGGSIGFYNITMHQLYHSKTPCHMNINFNEYVLKAWNMHEGDSAEYRDEIQHLEEKFSKERPTPQEVDLLDMIRDGKYKSFKIRRSGGGKLTVNARHMTKVQEEELEQVLKKRDYAEITVVKRDGKVVHVSLDDMYLI